jgi:hypothetical protein
MYCGPQFDSNRYLYYTDRQTDRHYCMNSNSNAAAILSYKTCVAAHSLTVTGVYITVTDRQTVLQEQRQ